MSTYYNCCERQTRELESCIYRRRRECPYLARMVEERFARDLVSVLIKLQHVDFVLFAETRRPHQKPVLFRPKRALLRSQASRLVLHAVDGARRSPHLNSNELKLELGIKRKNEQINKK